MEWRFDSPMPNFIRITFSSFGGRAESASFNSFISSSLIISSAGDSCSLSSTKSDREPSPSSPAGEDGEGSLSDFVEDKEQASPADDIISDELMNELNKALSALPPKEEKVIRMKFGIGESKRHSMEEIARQLNISRERVRQIEAKALRKLRHPTDFKSLKIFLDK